MCFAIACPCDGQKQACEGSGGPAFPGAARCGLLLGHGLCRHATTSAYHLHIAVRDLFQVRQPQLAPAGVQPVENDLIRPRRIESQHPPGQGARWFPPCADSPVDGCHPQFAHVSRAPVSRRKQSGPVAGRNDKEAPNESATSVTIGWTGSNDPSVPDVAGRVRGQCHVRRWSWNPLTSEDRTAPGPVRRSPNRTSSRERSLPSACLPQTVVYTSARPCGINLRGLLSYKSPKAQLHYQCRLPQKSCGTILSDRAGSNPARLRRRTTASMMFSSRAPWVTYRTSRPSRELTCTWAPRGAAG